MAAKVDALLEALVNHATRHGGDVTDIVDAWDEYNGNPTAAERTEEATAEAEAEQAEGKARNKSQVEAEKGGRANA